MPRPDARTERRLSAFARELEEALGGQLVSVVLHGSAAGEEWVAGRSDLNIAIVVPRVTAEVLEALAPVVGRWRRHGFGTRGHRHAVPVRPARSPAQAYGIGLIHGMGGSAGVGVLPLAAIPDRPVAVMALLLFAACTAISMAVASTTFGYTVSRNAVQARFATVAPALGALSLAFGAWYALGAVKAVPYVF